MADEYGRLLDLLGDFGFEPDFENAKYQLEKGDGSGNTFKATAKPVLIGTAVVGATTMVFGIIILLENLFGGVVGKLSLVQPEIILGLLIGGTGGLFNRDQSSSR